MAYGAVVVTCVSIRMPKVSPVRSAEYHVQAEDCDAGCVVVLVKHSLKLHVEKGRTFFESNTTRGVEATGLFNTVSALTARLRLNLMCEGNCVPGIR